jgi:predicted CXXCH cytochrome family protein
MFRLSGLIVAIGPAAVGGSHLALGGKPCAECHASVQAHQSVHKPVRENLCNTCHQVPAAGGEARLMLPVEKLCIVCHPKKSFSGDFVHWPVSAGLCATCHDPHGTETQPLLRARVNDLCLECHGAKAEQIAQSTTPVPLFDGRVSLAPKLVENISWLQLRGDGRIGHPLPTHPVFAGAKNGKPELNCLSCHRPHAAKGSRQLLVTESPNTSLLCVRCHG